jgi:hypothetical protein
MVGGLYPARERSNGWVVSRLHHLPSMASMRQVNFCALLAGCAPNACSALGAKVVSRFTATASGCSKARKLSFAHFALLYHSTTPSLRREGPEAKAKMAPPTTYCIYRNYATTHAPESS